MLTELIELPPVVIAVTIAALYLILYSLRNAVLIIRSHARIQAARRKWRAGERNNHKTLHAFIDTKNTYPPQFTIVTHKKRGSTVTDPTPVIQDEMETMLLDIYNRKPKLTESEALFIDKISESILQKKCISSPDNQEFTIIWDRVTNCGFTPKK